MSPAGGGTGGGLSQTKNMKYKIQFYKQTKNPFAVQEAVFEERYILDFKDIFEAFSLKIRSSSCVRLSVEIKEVK